MSDEPFPARSAPRQTQSYLRQLLEANGLQPRRQLGQNFLIDLNLLDILVRAADIGPDDVLLEVGAGTGSLTSRLADAAKEVVAVEIDPGFARLVEYEIRDRTNVRLLSTDALKSKNQLNPEVIEAVREAMVRANVDHYSLVSNLPYDVATSVISNLLLDDLPIRSLTFTVQFEMAQRLTARPRSKEYGPISVLTSTVGRVAWIRTLPAEAFWPKPKIQSAILRIDVFEPAPLTKDELRAFHQFVRELFLHRRKHLRATLLSLPRFKPHKEEVDARLSALGLASDERAERQSPVALYRLYQGLRAMGANEG